MDTQEMNAALLETLKGGFLNGYLFFTDAWLGQTQNAMEKI
jgi:hypothetical protein